MYKCSKWITIFCIGFLLSGCWDQVESEERGYVIGVALDAIENQRLEDIEQVKEDSSLQNQNEGRFKATYQLVVTSALQSSGSSDGQGSGDAFLNLTSTGNTMFTITRDIAKQTSRAPYLEHIKVIIMSEELARKGYFSKLLDIFLRDHEMRRATKVLISKGEALELFQTKSKIEKLPVIYIDSISENTFKNAEMLPITTTGDVHAFLLSKKSFAIPTIFLDDQNVKVEGAAVFNSENQKMVGYLTKEETEGLNYIRGDVKGGVIEIVIDGQRMAVEIKEAKRKFHADLSNSDHVKVTVNIEAEGNVGETFEGLDLLNPKMISKIEKEVAKNIEKLAEDVITKTQEDYQADILGIGSYLHQDHYQTWNKIKKDWEQGEHIFSKSNIEVKAKVKVRNIGVNIESNK
ncbi:Ger(x)C family spore germination protein [Metabacillus sediminilitoris]|uniref:Ger(X)C family spore germination protein n=1 Tax=Metabacillus sediminilitoris TaxID=2567941 RepID=A0A4S4C5F0_9BACI|nr:Ger(x)C family spore germination protein [Metabacillus sediminilitoris]QGQ45237.1 Ger(x)C family spore germination protein [Metabacillus sediminilitoris]THF82464.1 Ger(x)C family spore germination protein [Metabacillus sediminilitoris]